MKDEDAEIRAMLQELQPDDLAFLRRILELHEKQDDGMARRLVAPIDTGTGVVTLEMDDRTARAVLRAIRDLDASGTMT